MSTARGHWRFSLRTMFIVVTLVALILGWNYKSIRERERARNAVVVAGGRVMIQQSDGVHIVDREDCQLPLHSGVMPITPEVSAFRCWLGDVSVVSVEIYDGRDCGYTVEQLARLFPEAGFVTSSRASER